MSGFCNAYYFHIGLNNKSLDRFWRYLFVMDAEEFIKPPEAPVFQPTHEEFKDPIAYLSKIRPVVLNTGICKIKPPSVSATVV